MTRGATARLVMSTSLGGAAGLGVGWLLVALSALRNPERDVDVVAPAHVVALSLTSGAVLTVAAGLALVNGSDRWVWLTAALLVPTSLGWALEPSSRPYVAVGVAAAGALATTLALPRDRHPGPRRRPVLAAVAAVGALVCAVVTVDDVLLRELSGAVPLMVHHTEDASVLGFALAPLALGGAALGSALQLWRRDRRRDPRRPA